MASERNLHSEKPSGNLGDMKLFDTKRSSKRSSSFKDTPKAKQSKADILVSLISFLMIYFALHFLAMNTSPLYVISFFSVVIALGLYVANKK